MDHGSLHDVIHNETILIDGEWVFPLLQDIVKGLRYLHSEKPCVIHGDLKAQNVLVDSRFRAKVANFGLSQKKLLSTNGNSFWMAPELLQGISMATMSSDVYSFGILLYEVYSRQDPYEGEGVIQVLRDVADPTINKRPPVPTSCSKEIRSIMVDCLSANPTDRPTFEALDFVFKNLDATNVECGSMQLSTEVNNDRRADNLLFEVFPQHIAQTLRDGRKVEPEYREMVTIFFSDIVGFTNISSTLSPMKISDLLDRLYNSFDALSHKHDVFKVETIGDSYMAVTNLIKDQPNHTKYIAQFSIEAVNAAKATLIDVEHPDLGCVNIRVGFHSGPVVANVVGSRNPRYCLFGDTVNTASRMESYSRRNYIHCSETAAILLWKQDRKIRLIKRGVIDIKGKGEMKTYWVGRAPNSD